MLMNPIIESSLEWNHRQRHYIYINHAINFSMLDSPHHKFLVRQELWEAKKKRLICRFLSFSVFLLGVGMASWGLHDVRIFFYRRFYVSYACDSKRMFKKLLTVTQFGRRPKHFYGTELMSCRMSTKSCRLHILWLTNEFSLQARVES